MPGEHAKPLDEEQQAKWDAVRHAIDDFAKATAAGDEKAMAEAMERTRAVGLDHKAVLNALHLPSDAGEWADCLLRILRRIPDGWGRWIGVGPGWYPLICRLEAECALLDPAFEIHQVKEKFGTLRFYFTCSPEAYAAMEELVSAAEGESARTCELCGGAGRMHSSSGTWRGWLQTLCDACGKERGYLPLEEDL